MAIRCKVEVIQKVNQVSQYQSVEDGRTIYSKPICSVILAALSDPADLRRSRQTPRVELTIDCADAYDSFIVGQVYFVEFTADHT